MSEKLNQQLDDYSYSLLEYSEQEGISYVTDAKQLYYDADVLVINTFARFDKLKPKELAPMLEHLFLMNLQKRYL